VTLRAVGWNLLGFGLPLVVAVVCIPPLIADLGAARFGLLTLVWAVVSYFGIFDLGLGRALTQRISSALGAGRPDAVAGIACTGLAVMAVLGAVSGLLLWGVTPQGVSLIAGLTDPSEASATARAMAWSLPFVVLTSGLRGVLESHGAFRSVNLIRIVTGTLTYALPLAVVRAGSNDLETIAWSLGAMRAFGCAWHAAYVARSVPGAFAPRSFDRSSLPTLLRFGGWLTVGNVVSPLMGYLDRFVVAAVLSLNATAWYVTPKEMVTKLLVVPTALGNVLFPRLSELGTHAQGVAEAERLERWASSLLFAALFPVTLGLALAAPTILHVWIGEEFAREGATAMAIVSLGVLLNGLATVPYLAIQARGRADATAIVNLCELPVFVAAAYAFTREWGVTGAAMAWSLRVGIDLVALSALSARLRPRPPSLRYAWIRSAMVASAVAAFGAAAIVAAPGTRAGVALAATVVAFALLAAAHPGILRQPSRVLARFRRVRRRAA
jgi:O-antigen/teichoic acid export membrane protein